MDPRNLIHLEEGNTSNSNVVEVENETSLVPKEKRRSWTDREKQAFIHVLHELVVEGLKTDNSFKKVMLGHCVTRMEQRVPGIKISKEQVKNKLLVWKRDFSKIWKIATSSGFGWDDKQNHVKVEDDVWELYAKAHKGVEKLRFKTCPYYKDWLVIFGSDIGTGVDSKDCNSSLKRMEEKRASLLGKRSKENNAAAVAFGEETETSNPTIDLDATSQFGESVTGGVPQNDQPKKKAKPFVLTPKNSRKEAHPSVIFQDLVKEFMASTNCKIDEGFMKMAEASRPILVAPVKEPTKAELVIKYVNELELEKSSRLCVTARIATNPMYADFFIAVDVEDRREFVQQILQGKV